VVLDNFLDRHLQQRKIAMTQPQLNLLVIRARDIDLAAQFYCALGLTFERHQHGNGPAHYAAATADWVFEIW